MAYRENYPLQVDQALRSLSEDKRLALIRRLKGMEYSAIMEFSSLLQQRSLKCPSDDKEFDEVLKFLTDLYRLDEPSAEDGSCAYQYCIISDYSYHGAVQKLQRLDKRKVLPRFTYIRQEGSTIIRPPTFKETLEAIVTDFNTEKDEKGGWRSRASMHRFLNGGNGEGFGSKLEHYNTCTALAFSKDYNAIKIITLCKELIEIPVNFQGSFLEKDFNVSCDYSYWGGSKAPVSETGALDSPIWMALAGEDKSLLKEFVQIVFHQGIHYTGFWEPVSMAFCAENLSSSKSHLQLLNLEIKWKKSIDAVSSPIDSMRGVNFLTVTMR